MATVKEIVYAILNEVKEILKEYMRGTQNAIKQRIKKLLIVSIIGTILLALITSFFGSASLFILIGSIKYLSTIMPAWEAWYVTGITSGIIGAILLAVLFLIIRKQLKSTEPPTQKQN